MKQRFDRYLLELRLVLDAIDPARFEAAAAKLTEADRLFVAGLGRTGAVMRAFAARLAQAGRRVHVVLEPGCPDFAPGDVLVLGSGSGATRTMTAVAEEARGRGAAILLVTGNMLSPLNREADQTLYLPPTLSGEAEGASGVQPGRTAFEQALLLVLDALAERVAERRGRSGTDPA